LLCLLSLAVIAARAQNGIQFRDWKPGLNNGPEIKAKLACSSLVSQTSYEFSIETATPVAEAGAIPAYCLVTGQIAPEIRFEVSLPASWNGRFYMFGNGGYAGESLTAPARVNFRQAALRRGFAVAQTNTGHDAASEPLGSFAVNRQKMLDYAWRAVHLTAETSKRLMRSYYGQAPSRSYFDGCSTGGRQGLMSAQRFPEDFDGIVVGAPVLDFTGTTMMGAWNARALSAAAIPPEKMKLVAERVYARCDAVDGLTDGLLDDPRRCPFDPAKDLPLCPGETDGKDCLTAAQVRALQAIYGGVESQGKRIFWGQPLGAEIDMPGPGGQQTGWMNWIIMPGRQSIAAMFAETFYRYLAFPKLDPNYDLKSFNFDADPAKLQNISRIIDAKDPDLSRFKAGGGKIVMYFGWADPALNPLMGINYYEQVSARFGPSTTDFFRLFMVPGMAHCRGGVGTDEFDALTALVEWVEKGVAPQQLMASQTRDGKPVRSRPLCPYPQVARYKGTGDANDARNFVCAKP
jgi:feruloyl esterase